MTLIYFSQGPQGEVFSDGSMVDWCINEPLESIHLGHEDSYPSPITPAHMDAKVAFFEHPGVITITVPVQRSGQTLRQITVNGPLTFCKLVTAIHAFYYTPIKSLDEIADVKDEPWGYIDKVRKKLEQGEVATYIELVGSPDPFPPAYLCGESRRGPFSCCGLVRYEGCRIVVPGHSLELTLGS